MNADVFLVDWIWNKAKMKRGKQECRKQSEFETEKLEIENCH